MSFQEKLRYYREKAGYKQAKEFAEKLGIPYSTYAGYEIKSREPKYETLIKIADLLNVSLDELLGRNEKYTNENIIPKNDDEKLKIILNNLLINNKEKEAYEFEHDTNKSGFFDYHIVLRDISKKYIVFQFIDDIYFKQTYELCLNKLEFIKKMNEFEKDLFTIKQVKTDEFLFKLLRLNQQKEEYPMLKEWLDSSKPEKITALYKSMLDILKRLETDLNKQENIDLINRFLNNNK